MIAALIALFLIVAIAIYYVRNSYKDFNVNYEIHELSEVDEILKSIDPQGIIAIDVRYDYYFFMNHISLELRSGRMIHLNIQSIPMLDQVLEKVKTYSIK